MNQILKTLIDLSASVTRISRSNRHKCFESLREGDCPVVPEAPRCQAMSYPACTHCAGPTQRKEHKKGNPYMLPLLPLGKVLASKTWSKHEHWCYYCEVGVEAGKNNFF